ncbi:hypothetical protein BH09VER1_BH09VER1_19910 [soil metagenome]
MAKSDISDEMAGQKPKGTPIIFPHKALIATFLVGAIILGLGWLVDVRLRMDTQANLVRGQERLVTEQKYLVRTELNDLAATASILAQIAESHLKTQGVGAASPDGVMRDEFLSFARTRQTFEQIRLVGPDGRELIDIKRIRTKTGTSYFRDTTSEKGRTVSGEPWAAGLFALPPGKVFFSSPELRTDESGKVDLPYIPIMRVGAAIPVEKGTRPSGYVIVDYAVANLFQKLARSDERLGVNTLLANEEGYWLLGRGRDEEWGFLFPDKQKSTLAISHPALWKQMSQSINGTVTDASGLIVYDTVSLLPGESPIATPGTQHAIKLLTWQNPAFMAMQERAATIQLWWAIAAALGLFMPVTYLTMSTREQQREASRAREKAGALLQSISDTSIDGIIAGEAVRDGHGDIRDFRIVMSNPAAAHILKTFDRGATGEGTTREFPLFFSPDFFAQCVHVVSTGSRFETEQSAESKTLGRRWFRIVVVRLDDGVVLTFSDITRQKFIVHELRQAKESAEVANRAKSQFLTMMGHEIRTPMNGLLGFASLLEKTPLTAEQEDYVSTLRMSGEALLRILEDILDYSHMEYEVLQIKSVPVDVSEVVNQVSQLFGLALGDRNLELVTRLGSDIPPQILGDDTRLRQILVNLVGNALKFTEEGFILLKVSREQGEGGDLLVFHVVDSGPGVAPEMVDRLFKPFSQVDASFNRRFGGTGLGLSICKRLVESMGGQIGAHTAPGKGSDFHFSLPIRIPEFVADEAMPLRSKLAGGAKVPCVLVVDDDPINRKLILRMIEKIGARAELAESGSQALLAFQKGSFDLVLMDIQMPGMDGLEVTRRIRAMENLKEGAERIYISALTANSAASDREQCLQAGMDGFLCKPIRIEDLERIIENNVA